MYVLFSIYTYYQLIVAIKLRKTVFAKDNVDIIMHNHSEGYKIILDRLQKEDIFNCIFVAYTNHIISFKSKIKSYLHVFEILADKNIVPEYCDMPKKNYDELIFYNCSYFNSSLYYELKKMSPQLKCSRIEEGCFSLFDNSITNRSVKLQVMCEKLHKKPHFEMNDKMYVFDRELVQFNNISELAVIPKIRADSLDDRKIYNMIFNYEAEATIYEKYKYIFFEQPFVEDGITVDDIKAVLNIACIVGKDNILIKIHPRSKTDRFRKLGFQTAKSAVPWEVIAMNLNISEKVLITVDSGSVFSPAIMLGKDVTAIVIYKCTDLNVDLVPKGFEHFIMQFESKYRSSCCYIPNGNEELEKLPPLRSN